MNHTITREHTGGMGLGSTHQPVCSCGWRGQAINEANDYKYTELHRQEMGHIKDVGMRPAATIDPPAGNRVRDDYGTEGHRRRR